MNYKNSAAKNENQETRGVEDEKIRALLGALDRVEAPNDFDFRVRARIAAGSPAACKPGFLPVLRYGLALGAVLLIAAGFVFNSLYFADLSKTAIVAKIEEPPPIAAEKSNNGNAAEANPLNASSLANPETVEKEFAVLTEKPFAGKVKTRPAAPRNLLRSASVKTGRLVAAKTLPEKSTAASGTRYSAASPPKRIITPPEFAPNKTVGNLSDFTGKQTLSVKEVLTQLGVESSFTGAGWKVSAVRENSLAKRPGVEKNDVIEAIDGEKLTDQPLQNAATGGKKLTVERAGRKIEIAIGIEPN